MKKKYKQILFEIINYELKDIILTSTGETGEFTGCDVYDDQVQDDWTSFY